MWSAEHIYKFLINPLSRNKEALHLFLRHVLLVRMRWVSLLASDSWARVTNRGAVCHSPRGDWLLLAEPTSELRGKHKVSRSATPHSARVRVSSGCVAVAAVFN